MMNGAPRLATTIRVNRLIPCLTKPTIVATGSDRIKPKSCF
ncbi:hypothetical protein PATSB16_40080 [Pandoraea thiooxydans]|nr:hypothetical protein PATSB16_40080 [Pandoraea thiooxydans]